MFFKRLKYERFPEKNQKAWVFIPCNLLLSIMWSQNSWISYYPGFSRPGCTDIPDISTLLTGSLSADICRVDCISYKYVFVLDYILIKLVQGK